MNSLVIRVAVVLSIGIIAQLFVATRSNADWSYEPPWYGGCPNFTQEQLDILMIAIDVGGRYDPELYAVIQDHIRYTTMAMVTREAFVGKYVIRQNPRDGTSGSYGVMHVLVTTAFTRLYDMGYTWRNRHHFESEWIVTMLTDDRQAIEDGVAYLKMMIIEQGTLWGGVRAYNGAGIAAERYAQDVRYRVNKLIECGY